MAFRGFPRGNSGLSFLGPMSQLMGLRTNQTQFDKKSWQDMIGRIMQYRLGREGQQAQLHAANSASRNQLIGMATEPVMDVATMGMMFPLMKDLMNPASKAASPVPNEQWKEVAGQGAYGSWFDMSPKAAPKMLKQQPPADPFKLLELMAPSMQGRILGRM